MENVFAVCLNFSLLFPYRFVSSLEGTLALVSRRPVTSSQDCSITLALMVVATNYSLDELLTTS